MAFPRSRDTHIFNFAIERLDENKKVRETVLACVHIVPNQNVLSKK